MGYLARLVSVCTILAATTETGPVNSGPISKV